MHLELLTQHVINISQRFSLSDGDQKKVENDVRFILRCHIADVLNLMVNINETSVGINDQQQRLKDLGKICGLVYNQDIKRFT